MDDRAFTRQLCAWLDPLRLCSLVVEYARDAASLERRGRATREARSFRRAADVGLDRLIRAFLEHFELSADVVANLAGASQLNLSADALGRLTGLRFTGEASFENFDASDPEDTVVADYRRHHVRRELQVVVPLQVLREPENKLQDKRNNSESPSQLHGLLLMRLSPVRNWHQQRTSALINPGTRRCVAALVLRVATL
jgi:hypothetical protein